MRSEGPRRWTPGGGSPAAGQAIVQTNAVTDAPDIFAKQYLMTAGPTPLPPRVSQVMAEPVLYHRAPAFVEVYARALENLKVVFQTSNDVLCFAASGTGAME